MRIDANGGTTILAWSIVKSENLESWKYSFTHLQLAMPEVFLELLITISNRDKGLEAENPNLELPDTVVHLKCCQHLKESVAKRRGGSPLYKYFSKIVKASTEEKFTYHMDQLRGVSTLAAAYLEKVNPITPAKAYVSANILKRLIRPLTQKLMYLSIDLAILQATSTNLSITH